MHAASRHGTPSLTSLPKDDGLGFGIVFYFSCCLLFLFVFLDLEFVKPAELDLELFFVFLFLFYLHFVCCSFLYLRNKMLPYVELDNRMFFPAMAVSESLSCS